ncbi:hypothetical protein N790_01525 [Arenimonas malthae CC-JY-1]|uniref:Sugar kinase n=1 Tax=Arenimonas malthae CC-JY-1 TaxID=1384054 RepID=A0A091B9Y0_9GAMM|nr:sugar kinase [Arenimonas malthae]KFN48526.1 hypothetical protein N790_01525 [Arenimonas malthae CC-JY-1]
MDESDRKIILVTRKTRLQELVLRYNTVEQARFQAEHLGMDFGDFLVEDEVYAVAVRQVEAVLQAQGRLQRLDRTFLPNFLFPPTALVVVLGQDGLVANTLKYLQDGQKVLAINPDPDRWDGVLLPFGVSDLPTVLGDFWAGREKSREVVMAMASLTDGQTLLAVNDFFVGMRGHASARYEITHGDRHERQSSSGIIVSTGLGSTGWLRSVLTGAKATSGAKMQSTAETLLAMGLPWEAKRLVYAVREPFPGRWSKTSVVLGEIEAGEHLRIRSLMPEGGVIFSDGVEADGLDFRSGLEASIGFATTRGLLLT